MTHTPTNRRRYTRRAVIGTLAAATVGTPLLLSQTATAAPASDAASTTPQWHPVPSTDGLKAYEGLEYDRTNLFPSRNSDYIYAEDADHYRFNIWRDDRDTTGGGDRQRTEAKGMVQNGTALKMVDGETWNISYEMYMPSTLHGTGKFTHIFQTKIPSTDAGPFVTLDLTRESATSETLRARAYANPGSPTIAATPLGPLRETWVSIRWTLTIGSSGSARFVCLDSAGKTVADGTKHGVNIPDQGDYVRPKWGIYRSVESAAADIVDTHILFRHYQASRA